MSKLCVVVIAVALALVLGVSDARMLRGHFSHAVAASSKHRETTISELVATARSLEDDDDEPRTLPTRVDVESTYSSCKIDLASAIATIEDSAIVQRAKIKSFGMRFAVCAIQEIQAEKDLETLRTVLDVLASPLTASIAAIEKAVSILKAVVTLDIASCLDHLVDIVKHATGTSLYFKIASGIIHVISRLVTDIDIRVTLCSLCAMGMKYALTNLKGDPPRARFILNPPTASDEVREEVDNLKQALTYTYTDRSDVSTSDICSLHSKTKIALAAATTVNGVLEALVANKVHQLRELVLYNVHKFINEPAHSIKDLVLGEQEQINRAIAKLNGESTDVFDLKIPERDVASTYFDEGDDGATLPNLDYISQRGCYIYCTPYRKMRYCCDFLGTACSKSEMGSGSASEDSDGDAPDSHDGVGVRSHVMDRSLSSNRTASCSQKNERQCYSSCSSRGKESGSKNRDCDCVIC